MTSRMMKRARQANPRRILWIKNAPEPEKKSDDGKLSPSRKD